MSAMGLLAYHNNPAIKAKYIGRMHAHLEADDLVRGTYWKNGKGCAIGCTVHSSEHKAYETELGMPEWFARLEDKIFEGMSEPVSRQFPIDLLSVIPVGFEKWDKLYHEFCIFLLYDICEFDRAKYPDVASIVDAVIRLHEHWTKTDDQTWKAVELTAQLAMQAVELTAQLAMQSAAWKASCVARVAQLARPTAYTVDSMAIAAARSAAEKFDVWPGYMTWSTAYDNMGSWLIRWFKKEDCS